MTLNNTVANTGTIAVNAASHDATLEINNTTLTGHGAVKLTNNVGNMITSDQAAGSVTDATLSVDINGTVHVGDEVQVSFTVQGDNSTVSAGLTIFTAGTTTASVATQLAGAINVQLSALDIHAAASSNTLVIHQTGSLGNNATNFSFSTNGSETFASTPASGKLTGGTGAASILDNIDNTISGAGTIGDGNNLQLINEANGVIDANGTQALTIDTGDEAVINNGTIESTAAGGVTINSNVVDFGKLVASAGVLKIQRAVTDEGLPDEVFHEGTAAISGKGEIELSAAINSVDVIFAAGDTGELKLDQVGLESAGINPFTVLKGTIFGFGANATQSIDLVGVSFATATKQFLSLGDGTAGLIVQDGSGDEVDLTFAGNFTSTSFTLKNDGSGGTLIVDPPVDTRAHVVADGSTLELHGAVAGKITFAGTTGSLKLDDATDFTGQIAGMRGANSIDLANLAFGAGATLGYAPDAGGATLTVSNGSQAVNIALLGNYMAANFALSSDGHGGTLITEPLFHSEPVLTRPNS